MNHTATPWIVEYPEPGEMCQGAVILGGKKGTEPVCEILGPLDDEDGPHRGAADLALILAAPALLAACKAILGLETHEPSPAWDMIRSAIRLAEGVKHD